MITKEDIKKRIINKLVRWKKWGGAHTENILKGLDYLLTERELDFSITDMAKNAGIGRATLYRIWGALIKNRLILPTRVIGKAKLFKLNKENPKVRKLIEIDDMLILEELKKRAHKEVVV